MNGLTACGFLSAETPTRAIPNPKDVRLVQGFTHETFPSISGYTDAAGPVYSGRTSGQRRAAG
ncbi:MAG: hypothetical protein KDH08_24445, partial [Anaerolineae bacterium]|nr:hypothetical protein [Anaerolineae bacterium]